MAVGVAVVVVAAVVVAVVVVSVVGGVVDEVDEDSCPSDEHPAEASSNAATTAVIRIGP